MSSEAGRPRSVPWKDWNEWTEVKSLLYVGDDDQEAAKGLIEGLGMVDVWRARGGLPHSIEAQRV